jgi:hypothetical protein
LLLRHRIAGQLGKRRGQTLVPATPIQALARRFGDPERFPPLLFANRLQAFSFTTECSAFRVDPDCPPPLHHRA